MPEGRRWNIVENELALLITKLKTLGFSICTNRDITPFSVLLAFFPLSYRTVFTQSLSTKVKLQAAITGHTFKIPVNRDGVSSTTSQSVKSRGKRYLVSLWVAIVTWVRTASCILTLVAKVALAPVVVYMSCHWTWRSLLIKITLSLKTRWEIGTRNNSRRRVRAGIRFVLFDYIKKKSDPFKRYNLNRSFVKKRRKIRKSLWFCNFKRPRTVQLVVIWKLFSIETNDPQTIDFLYRGKR